MKTKTVTLLFGSLFVLSAWRLFLHTDSEGKNTLQVNASEQTPSAENILSGSNRGESEVINSQLEGLDKYISRTESKPSRQNKWVAENATTIIITNGTSGINSLEGDAEFRRCPQLHAHMKCRYQHSVGDTMPPSHAVIFKPFNIKENYKVPGKHHPEQKWIFYETEAPYRTWNQHRMSLDFWDSFNLSIIYTDDADIQHSRFAFQCTPDPEYKPSKERNFARENKTGNAVWMVSNCKFTSGREIYVEELQKYMDIDVYGSCGKGIQCGPFGQLNVTCVKEFISHYKFYLAFENSFCENYYTEKLTKLIGVNTIPVVMGLVNYTEVMPPGSFIDVRDYSSPKQLAEHLQYLSKNDTAYNQYIERKRSVICTELFPNKFMCRLCYYLHMHKNEMQTIPDARRLWGVKERCKSPEDFFHGIADTIISNITS